jgi:cytochrome c oxidase assembly factor CtaG
MARIAAVGLCPGAGGCGALGPLSWGKVFGSGTFDPSMIAVLVLLVAGYVVGVRRYKRIVGPWPISRSACFAASMTVFAFATLSFVGTYSLTLFWVRGMQNAMLLMTVPLLLASGAPITLLLTTTGGFGRALERAIGTRLAKILTFPAVVSGVLLITPYLLYFTGWYQLTMTSTFFNESLHLELMLVGFAYFWTRIRVDPVPYAYSHLVSVWISFVEGIGDAGVALLLWLGSGLTAGSYYASLSTASHAALYAPLSAGTQSGLAWNQALGGAAFWFVGDMTSIPLLAALFRGLRREENAAADAAQDDLEVVGVEYAPAGGAPQELYRPWWETDPELSSRYGHATPETGPGSAG